MNREEAISIITKERDEDIFGGWTPHRKRIHEAFTLAIEALKREPNGDLISRAEAIDAIEIVDWYHQNSNKDMVHGANDDEHQAWYKADDVYKALEAVPSAVRPRGYWKDGKWCSVCGMPIATDVWGTSVDESEVHYCIECGAEMRGETNE